MQFDAKQTNNSLSLSTLRQSWQGGVSTRDKRSSLHRPSHGHLNERKIANALTSGLTLHLVVAAKSHVVIEKQSFQHLVL
jgi:hypothetical protein